MNKLMLAATMAITMGGYAMAQCGIIVPGPVTTICNPLVYDFTLNLKTTHAKPGKIKTGPCGIENEPEAYRVKGSRKLQGFIASCDCWCPPEKDDADKFIPGTFAGFNDANWTVVLWDKKAKLFYADEADEFAWDAFWRIGKNPCGATDLETSWNLTGEYANLFGAGWGKVDKNGLVKNMSGNAAGYLHAPMWSKTGKKEDDCFFVYAYPYSFCECFEYLDDVPTIAFGNWKMKYNAKASAVSKASGDLSYLLPKNSDFWIWE